MDPTVERMEAQLALWDQKIDELAIRVMNRGVRASLEDIVEIDELRVLRATARAQLDEFRATAPARRAHLKVAMDVAWTELDAAFRSPRPPSREG